MNSNNENNENELERPQDGTESFDDVAADDSVSLDSGRPAVASAPGKIMVFVVAAVVFVAIVAKSLFFSDDAPPPENKIAKLPERVTAATGQSVTGGAAGELPMPAPPEPIGSFSSRSTSGYTGSAPVGGGMLGAGKLTPPTPGANGKLTPSGTSQISIASPAVPTGASPAVITPPSIAAPTLPSISSPVMPATAGSVSLPPPPPPPGLSSPVVPEVKTSLPRDEAAMQRLQTPMVTYGGGAATKPAASKGGASGNGSGFVGNDPNSQFANSVVTNSAATSAQAQRIDNLHNTIIEGKIIHSILETAINSDLPGTIRAIVSHDVYAEAGRNILIPKGSRLLGTYNATVKRGQTRVFIVWTRVVRPDGITVLVGSPGVDSLGRAGIDGDVDNKYFEMFSNALLTSSMTIGVAAVGEALFGDDQSSTTTNTGTGGSTTTTSPSGEAMRQAVTNIGEVGKNIVGNVLNIMPTITIDQGTPVNVFVNKELIMPASMMSNLTSLN